MVGRLDEDITKAVDGGNKGDESQQGGHESPGRQPTLEQGDGTGAKGWHIPADKVSVDSTRSAPTKTRPLIRMAKQTRRVKADGCHGAEAEREF